MDLSKLVSGGGKLSGAWGDLAYKIGEVTQPCFTVHRAVSVPTSVEAVSVRRMASCRLDTGNIVFGITCGSYSVRTSIANRRQACSTLHAAAQATAVRMRREGGVCGCARMAPVSEGDYCGQECEDAPGNPTTHEMRGKIHSS